MKPRKAREFKAALDKKGFVLDRQTSDYVYYFWHNGLKTSIHTKVSMGSGEELGFRLLSKIKDQLRLDTSAQLEAFIDCPMEHADYVAVLRHRGAIP